MSPLSSFAGLFIQQIDPGGLPWRRAMDISIDGKQRDPVTQYVNTIFREKTNSETEFVARSALDVISSCEKCASRFDPRDLHLISSASSQFLTANRFDLFPPPPSLALSIVITEAVRASDCLIAKLAGSMRADKAEARRIPGERDRKNGRK